MRTTEKKRSVVQKGIRIQNSRIRFLRPALRGWQVVHEKYCEEFDYKEGIYWCNERANVGALCAGAWLNKMIALEEYPHETKNRGKPRPGKPDLYLRNPSKDEEAFLEAKLHWWGFYYRENSEFGRIEKLLRSACRQAIQRKDKDVKIALGAVFVVPGLLRDKRFGNAEMAKISEVTKADAIAWYLPKLHRRMTAEDKLGRLRSYPGVLLILKIATK